MTEPPYPPHEYALVIPPMSHGDYQRLRDSIAEQGQLRAITLYENRILDGVHRQRATLELGLRPRYEQYTGKDPLGYVIAHNIAGRQLNTTERAKIGARLAVQVLAANGGRRRPAPLRAPNGALSAPDRTDARVGKLVGVGRVTIHRASAVLRRDPALFDRMDGRKLRLNTAYNEVMAKRAAPERQDALSLDERRAMRHVRDVAAWKRVVAVNGAATRMWADRDELLGAIDRCRDPGAVEALAGQVNRTILQLQTVLDRALERISPQARDRVDALMHVQGWPR